MAFLARIQYASLQSSVGIAWHIPLVQGLSSYCSWTRNNHTDQSSESTSSSSSEETGRKLINRVARQALAAEVGASAFFRAQAKFNPGGSRIDLQYFKEQEEVQLQGAQRLLIRQRARPSLMQGVLGAAGMVLGAVSAVAPRRVSLAVTGALQDAMTDHFTEQLRELQESGVSAQVPEVREVIRNLRDVERAPEGAPAAPDLLEYSRMKSLSDLGVEGAVGAVVKAGASALLGLSSKL
ncbi:hypothetical protein CEUSTIGMA_g11743.t1 [Chlamydomonas eustigma]|uniref:Uncharacterized protein n=1 Tax=Chlamydomonas eustigma TaxID=1157962 RepID=A0A250XMJ0_9CHLO|nr:hypothetical protein CEUSTIGMA_g11743.t1 [Chlamydomonas eustigma]|eukprot:GAX84321.1 hypothetical protein CEUSTIGMA_g11743.t1 [Chlamydomonas eustigma]